MKTPFLRLTLLFFYLSMIGRIEAQESIFIDNSPGYDIAVYYFPNYHNNDLRNELRYGKGWSEWELVKSASPRFDGHNQPKIPLWGYTNESDPKIMEMKINTASQYGIDVFIYDWYYYNDGPFLEKGLEDGFMKVENNNKVKFALMWANHDWVDLFPRNPDNGSAPWCKGTGKGKKTIAGNSQP